MSFPCHYCLSGSHYPTPCASVFLRQGDSAAPKMSDGGIVPTLRTSRLSSHCRLKQTFHRVSGVLIPRTHNFSEHRARGLTKRFRRLLYLFRFFPFACNYRCHWCTIQINLPPRGQKEHLLWIQKHKLFIILRDLYKSILACECAMHHCRYRKGPCSHRFSSCLSKCVCVCVQSGCAASCMQTTFSHVTEDTQGCARLRCVYMKTTARRSRSDGGASPCLSVRLAIQCLH